MKECTKCHKKFHGSGFEERGHNGVYCSSECFDASVDVKTCDYCHKPYTGKTYGCGHCSPKCYEDAYYEPEGIE